MKPPIVVNISRLHRETSAVVAEAERSDRPLFVTQFASVVAVVLPRPMYDRLLRAAERGASGEGRGAGSSGEGRRDGSSGEGRRDGSSCEGRGPVAIPVDPLQDPLARFGPLPRGTRFLTASGTSVDSELAAFLMEDGDELTPVLPPSWDDDDDEDGGEEEPERRVSWV